MTPHTLPSLFNPSNDMALAANVRQYLPPKRIQQMEADLADLAQVWDGTLFAGPWGWSLATKQRYRRMGIADDLLPSDEWIAELRRLSSREFACRYIRRLLDELNDTRLLGHEMQWCERFDPALLSSFPLIFKLPWSSSGRGVMVAQTPSQLSRLSAQLSAPTGFLIDRFHTDKVLDFAMEFFIHPDATVQFLGYSVFQASQRGTYGFNYVESQDELLRRIIGDRDGDDGQFRQIEELLDRLIAYHQEHLAQTAYRGPLGIDMLMTADGRIHPCLEINFRMNMGILALLLHDRHGSHATLQLTPPRPNGFAASVEDGKLLITY